VSHLDPNRKHERQYLVVTRNAAGERVQMRVKADSEADALLKVQQSFRQRGINFRPVSSRAIRTED
jgi:prephenate dehydratase